LVSVAVVSTWWWWTTRGTVDVELWLTWMRQVTASGPRLGYLQIHADYPPGASAALWIMGQIAALVHVDPRIVLKLSLLICLLATVAMLLAASGRAGLSLLTYAALVLNSVGLMYLDILTAPFIVGAVWAAAAGRVPVMTGLLTCACLMKWQPIFVVPFAAIYVWRLRSPGSDANWRRQTVLAITIPLAIALGVIAFYGYPAFYDALNRAGHHNDLSNFGANPLWVLTWWFEWTARPGNPTLSPEGLVVILGASRPIIRVLSLVSLVTYAAVLRAYWRSGDRTVGAFVRFSLAGYLVYFLLSVGVHENHLFLANLLGVIVAWQEPDRLWVAAVLAIAANLNLVVFYGWQGHADRLVGGVDISTWVAAAISVSVAIVAVRLARSKARLPGPVQKILARENAAPKY